MTDVAKPTEFGDYSVGIRWCCPGCNQHHAVPTSGPKAWGFNGDRQRPTPDPSVLVNGIRGDSAPEWNAKNPRCHVFIRDGRIEFLSDCEHELAG